MFFKLTIIVGLLLVLSGCKDKNSPKKEEKKSEVIQKLTATQKEVIEIHNRKRREYFSDSDLLYSFELEKEAKRYADTLAKRGEFRHDPSNKKNNFGENLYAHSNSQPLTINIAMSHWYDDEKPLYNYSNGSCKKAYYKSGDRIGCGHYTQVIWQNTKEVGCATTKYRAGDMRNGYIYVCKYKKAGNSSVNGEKLKPYCDSYDKKDIYTGNAPSFNEIDLSGKRFKIELIEEDRVRCIRKDNYNSAIEFSSNMKSAEIKDFQIFNDGAYPNSLEFDSIIINGKSLILIGKNKNIDDSNYIDKKIYMSFRLIGETSKYYSVEIAWNGVDKNRVVYNREMFAKLYK